MKDLSFIAVVLNLFLPMAPFDSYFILVDQHNQ